MIFFITVLRALAACLITNAHYTGIYPSEMFANGGLIGDVIFFAVSGYCLYNIKSPFSIRGFTFWYGKRLWRVYPPAIIMTIVYMMLGFYKLSIHNFAWWYIYPTYYHFIASIIVLYIPFYFVMRIDNLKKHLISLIVGIGIIWLLVYFLFYDKSRYHIDTVREPMIRFLFMESMLLGAWFRQNDSRLRNRFKGWYAVALFVSMVAYFATKMLVSRRSSLAGYQFINQITIFILLYFVFRTFCGIDGKLEKMPQLIKRVISFISSITLEIYVVQYVLRDIIKDSSLVFPINWIVLTSLIIVTAFVLHKVCGYLYAAVDKALGREKA